MVSGRLFWKLLILFLVSAFLIKPVFASTTNGTISSGYAWSARIGWINFATTNGNVHVTDGGLTGSAWSELYGWIKLDPASSGVTNNSEGDLSGSAWGSNIGWVDFSGVSIGSDGIFYGTASGTNTGVVNFSCTNCLVQTDWRPASVRNASPSAVAIPVTTAGAIGSTPTLTSTDEASLTSSSTADFPKDTLPQGTNRPVLEGETVRQESPPISTSTSTSTSVPIEKEPTKSKEALSPIENLKSYFKDSNTVKNNLLKIRNFKWGYIIFILVVILLAWYFYKRRQDKTRFK